ncbi:histone-lysine N-methyltransferase SETMAR [Trichonephila clavipes]|nr:histone-lysine N-methyltransferase SETMAR [Trichonephila clavipes]
MGLLDCSLVLFNHDQVTRGILELASNSRKFHNKLMGRFSAITDLTWACPLHDESSVTQQHVENEPVSENTSQVAEITNGVYGADTVTANYVQFWFRRFRSGIFDAKVAPRTDRPVVENVDKITEIIEIDRHVSSPSITQELKIDHKTVLNHLRKVGFKKILHVWVPH